MQQAQLEAEQALREADAAVGLLAEGWVSLRQDAARILMAQGRHDQGAALLLQAVESQGPLLGEQHPVLQQAVSTLHDCLDAQGCADRTAELVQAALARGRAQAARTSPGPELR